MKLEELDLEDLGIAALGDDYDRILELEKEREIISTMRLINHKIVEYKINVEAPRLYWKEWNQIKSKDYVLN